MLEEVLRHLRNWFAVCIHSGTYTIENGVLDLPFLLEGQHFRITGSIFNDGVYTYPSGELTDETFTGDIWALAVPKALLDTVEEISAWQAKANKAAGPYESESFGGYAYTKAKASDGSGKTATWQSEFKSRLDTWRKL